MDSTIWTIGHSTHPIEKFLDLLAHYRIEAVADVRRLLDADAVPAKVAFELLTDFERLLIKRGVEDDAWYPMGCYDRINRVLLEHDDHEPREPEQSDRHHERGPDEPHAGHDGGAAGANLGRLILERRRRLFVRHVTHPPETAAQQAS